MKIFFYILLLMIPLISLSSRTYAQSQMELNEAVCQEFNAVDKEMNQVYQHILSQYQNDKLFIAAFINAQHQWLRFREANLTSMYPKPDKDEYGTVYRLCHCNTLTEMTTARLNQIKQWLDGVEEGNVCSGSVRIRNKQ